MSPSARPRRVLGALALAVAAVLALTVPSVAGAQPAPPSAPAGRHALQPAARVPAGAAVTGALPSTRPVSAMVVLAPNDPAALAAAVEGVSTPGSSQYRRYLTPAEFDAQYAPAPAVRQRVEAWLGAAGLTVRATSSPLALRVSGPAGAVQAAFATKLDTLRLSDGAEAETDTVAPSVPEDLAGVVRGVVGLDSSARWRTHLSTAPSDTAAPAAAGAPASVGPALQAGTGPEACPAVASTTGVGRGAYSANQIAGLYGLSALYAQGRTGAGETIALFELEPFSSADVEQFAQCYGLDPQIRAVAVDGGAVDAPSGEADLDIENAMVFAPGANLVVYEAPNTAAGVVAEYQRIAQDDAANVVSTSWGLCEIEDTVTQPESVFFSQMALQGQTVLASSGDSGSEDCFGPTNSDQALAVDDPASQPDVTGTGGTTVSDGTLASERVWNDCGSGNLTCATFGGGAGGGGVSNNWPLLAPQRAAGIHTSGTGCGAGAAGCRAVPDVAASADPMAGYDIVFDGSWVTAGGTSAVAPLWAAIVALVDQGCAAPVGLANPALYSLATSGAFHDITVGTNDLTGTNGGLYPAGPGYDEATGLGSPDGPTLLAGLQPAGGCPSVLGLSRAEGPDRNGAALTITGAGLGGARAVTFGAAGAGTIVSDSAGSLVVAPPDSTPRAVDVTVTTANGTSAVVAGDRYVFGTEHDGNGDWEVASDGGLFAFGDAGFFGSMGGRPLNQPIVGIAATPDGNGYWEVASDGGLFAFGDAGFFGSMGGRPLNQPIVGIAATPDGNGYWEVASDGGLFAFGDAGFFGSMGGRPLNQPIVGIAATPDGNGYWEVASDGGLFAFGDAGFFGSMGGRPLNQPIVGIAATPDGNGYWEVASDGGLFAFGDAGFFGSMGGRPLNQPIVGIAATPDGNGYWEVASDGGLFAFGDAGFFGSMGGRPLNRPIVGIASH